MKLTVARMGEAFDARALNQYREQMDTEGYVLFIKEGDILSENYEQVLSKYEDVWKKYPALLVKRTAEDGTVLPFSWKLEQEEPELVDLHQRMSCFPCTLDGVFLSADYLKKHVFREDIPYDFEKDYLFHLLLQHMTFAYVPAVTCVCTHAAEGDPTFYPGVYEEGWYRDSLDNFWKPFLKQVKQKYKELPYFLQVYVMYSMDARFETNLNNLNKHLIPEEEAYDYMRSYRDIFEYVSDSVLFNTFKIGWLKYGETLKLLYLKIKYGDDDLELQPFYYNGSIYLGYHNALLFTAKSRSVNIKFMDYVDGKLEIDATVSQMLSDKQGHFYVMVDNKKMEPEYNEMYSHTKCFGRVYTKRPSFRISVPLKGKEKQLISFHYEVEGRDVSLVITYQSHFSRLSKGFKNSYWAFDSYIARHRAEGIAIYKVGKAAIVKRELLLLLEMIKKTRKGNRRFLGYRIWYRLTHPFYKKKKIWFFMDKIYKAGDSSEYLYKYSCDRKDPDIRNYYLVDKDCPDYVRMKKEGYHPLKRGTLKHRMMFLMADMMVISNSTVFAYNDYTLKQSEYIRDLVNFHTCCVQHGMSVQKIAIAQNRLRDNLRLYFCASPYEIENLSKPIYGYENTQALRLTGVPRYDGLVNRDRKQILITPTWRMQAAVPVTKNEGVARDYNPLFKESDYYKVYNSLINDRRLIEAAKTYGYRIAYVLHPIVSPQAEDFDKNDYVDIIPAIGDMSYEKVFCESSLMVTDFSGVQFDFAYMRKPLVYLHHRDIPQHYEEGTFHYDTMAFGEICYDNEELITLLCEYMANGCKMKPEYVRRADDFFAFDDHKNCERIYKVMTEYQKTVIK